MRNKVYSVIYPIIWIFMRIIHPWKAVGVDNIPEGAAVICGNHTTLGDPLYVVCAMGGKRQTHVMAKAEVMKWPVIGFLLKKAGRFLAILLAMTVGCLLEGYVNPFLLLGFLRIF